MRTSNLVNVSLNTLNTALSGNGKLNVAVSRKWVKAAEAFLGVKIQIEGAPVADGDDEPETTAAVKPTISEA